MKPIKIAFFGTPQNAAIVLEKLVQTKYKPGLIITTPDVQQGRGQKLQESPVKTLASVHGIDVLEPEDLENPEFVKSFKNFAPGVAILVAYGKIIPQEVLNIPRLGFLNIHPSLLPKYRGPSPIYEVILAGDKRTGVTIIKLDPELDHGPILAQKELEIENADTHQSIMEKTAILGGDLLIEILPGYLDRSIKPKPQNHSGATYTEKIEKQNGLIDLNSPPDPKTLNRMIRAYFPWPTVWAEIETRDTKNGIRKFKIKFLPENKIQPEGKRPMSLKEFQNGYPNISQQISTLFD